jgi:hypothetical protein
MKKADKISQKVLLLLLDIFVLAWQVVRRVILPTLSRKGNVLSSLLTFFVELLERIVFFEKSILQRPVVFTHKYVRQGLVIAVGFLFLLSSIEWTIRPSADAMGNGSPEVVACASAVVLTRTVTSRQTNLSFVTPTEAVAAARFIIPPISSARTGPPVIAKRWLRLGVFRI